MGSAEGWRYLVLGAWQRFDTVWYLHIAAHGYDRPAATVFYPLYPILIHYLSWITREPTAAALLISTVACFYVFWGIQKLALIDRTASPRWALALMALWPPAFVFLAGYPDSLVTALAIWSVYWARNDRWWLAAMLAAAAGFTKATGVIVCVPLATILFYERRWRALPALAIAPAGFLAYAAWLRLSGFPNASSAYSAYWMTKISLPWNTLAIAVRDWVNNDNDWPLGLNLFALLLFTLILWFARHKNLEYILFSVAVLIVILTKETVPILQSTSRYLLFIFPAFLYWARIIERPVSGVLILLLMFPIYMAMLRFFLGWGLIV
jgi:hypothetical protein